MSIILDDYQILLDESNNVYNTFVEDNMEKNLKIVEDECIINILKLKEASCKLGLASKTSIVEVIPGILIFKNFNSDIDHNCNSLKIKQTGTFIIKFENCKLIIANNTYENSKVKMYDTFVLPSKITKIKENSNFTTTELKLEKLYIEQVKQKEHIKFLVDKNKNVHLISLSSDLLITFIIIMSIFIFIYIYKYKIKFYISPELQLPTRNTTSITSGPFLQIKTNS